MIFVFLLGLVLLAIMSFEAHSLAYFPGDIAISHVVQASSPDWLDRGGDAVSGLGSPPQSNVLFGVIVVTLFACGARWAAATEALAALGSGGLYLLLEHLVGQPRPPADLVRGMGPIQMTGYPSGHLATFTAAFGFLGYLGYRRRGGTRFSSL